MNQILEAVRNFADRKGAGIKSLVFVFGLLGVGLGVAAFFAKMVPVLPVVLGSAAGALWFLAGYLYWYSVMGEPLRSQINIRDYWEPEYRRKITLFIVGAWFIILILVSSNFPTVGPIVGGLNVTVLLTAWIAITLTPEERQAEIEALDAAEEEAAYWAAQQAEEAEANQEVQPQFVPVETSGAKLKNFFKRK